MIIVYTSIRIYLMTSIVEIWLLRHTTYELLNVRQMLVKDTRTTVQLMKNDLEIVSEDTHATLAEMFKVFSSTPLLSTGDPANQSHNMGEGHF